MSRTYKATGINLKSMALGESDRLLTILTREFGLIKAIAPGARKPHSTLGGRSALFVVNELLIAKGRSIDKITQAETIESFPALGQDLLKLAAAQYLAELVLHHALSEHPQEELFCLLNEHLSRLEQLHKSDRSYIVLAYLSHAVFHLLALAGIAPQVRQCCITQRPVTPDFTTPNWRVGFSISGGGTVSLSAKQTVAATAVRENPASYRVAEPAPTKDNPAINTQLNARELTLLQQLGQSELPQSYTTLPDLPVDLSLPNSEATWLSIEQVLRQYTQYHFGRPIRSAALIDSYFASLATSLASHDSKV